ncbi:GNAT family N-acetyltransferase [Aerococcaceae bacterium DSM 111176]|nr:GNAT family N-acetyltransferase [Aerococcaceae bacterium DSM 111176]
MRIRKTNLDDISAVLETFDHARKIIRATGNTVQWSGEYPGKIDIEEDIQLDHSYVCVATEEYTGVELGTVLATFALPTTPDPTYTHIDGAWLNDDEYATVHRIAANGKVKGAGRYCMEWIIDEYSNVRIDTHELNKPMLKLIKHLGFEYCGEIMAKDQTPRLAFQRVG